MEIKYKRLTNEAILPQKATSGSIAFDVYTPKDVVIESGRQVIPLDFAVELPIGYEFKIEPRSGFSSKGIEGRFFDGEEGRRFNADVLPGKVDSDYRGCVGVIINNNDVPFLLKKNTRIAQATIYHSDPSWEFIEVEELSSTERGDGGFGHTGTK